MFMRAVLFATIAATVAFANDDDDTHILTDMPEASPDVMCFGVLPKYLDDRLPIGETIDALVGIVNEGQEPINVTAITGSLNSPYDFNYYLQNFTESKLNVIILEDEEMNFRYQFKPIETIDLDVEYKIALTAFYENDEELFSFTFYNGTVVFYEAESASTTQMLVYGGAAVAALAGAFYLLNGGKSVGGRGGEAADDSAWVAGLDEKGAGRTTKTEVKRRSKRKSGSKKKKSN